MNISRRTAMMGAAGLAVAVAGAGAPQAADAAVTAEANKSLPTVRQKVALVAPPFVRIARSSDNLKSSRAQVGEPGGFPWAGILTSNNSS